ncbi:hypothetical protein F2B00_20825 [Streptomyces parvus]|uniref:hypothetical protein n=1 Tax=unclassified Streptomyces TaxID=2593676 RepID=UPI00123B9598|nr:hypothetical protein F2B00_20825 [Streptomyces parvus]GGS26823.1 hypothetical protein GCM10010221_25200 [Streptomyces parvus]
MKATSAFWRWALSPRTSFLAWRLSRASHDTISFDVAWREIRIRQHPEEVSYREAGHLPPPPRHTDA